MYTKKNKKEKRKKYQKRTFKFQSVNFVKDNKYLFCEASTGNVFIILTRFPNGWKSLDNFNSTNSFFSGTSCHMF